MFCCEEEKVALEAIPTTSQHIGQIVRLFFQRTRTAGVENALTVATEDPTLKATWDTLIAAVDSEKVITSPVFHEFSATAGGAIQQAGNQAFGIPKYLGENPSTWSLEFQDLDQAAVIQKIKDLMCEVGAADGLSFYAVNACGKIIGQSTDAYTTFKGIPLPYLSVGALEKFGRESVGANVVEMMLKADWANNLYEVSPAFDAINYNL